MNRLHSLLRFLLGMVVVAFAVFLFLPAVFGAAVEQKAPQPPKATAPLPSAAIPVAEVATSATAVSNLLHTLTMQLGPSHEIETIRKRLPEVSEDIALKLPWTRTMLQAEPTLAALQSQQELWQRQQLDMSKWLNLLTQRTTQLQEALNRLADLQETWNRTLDAAQASEAPGAIIDEINGVLTAVEAAQTPLQAERIAVIGLQSRVAQAAGQCETALGEIAQAERKAVGGLLARDNLPLWSPELWATARIRGPARLRQIAADRWAEIQHYVRDPFKGMVLLVGLFVAMALLSWAARRRVHRWEAAGERSSATSVFEHPYAVALTASLLTASSPHLPAPPTVRNLLEVLALAPIIRLVKPVVNPRMIPGLYAVGLLFALDTAHQAFAGAPIFEQVIIVLETVAGMTVLGWWLAFGSLWRPRAEATRLARSGALRLVASLILLALAAGLAAAGLGYMRLARLLVSSVLGGAALALTLAAAVQILGGMAAFGLRIWPFRSLNLVQHHSQILERRIYRVLVFVVVGGWLIRILDYLGLLQPALSAGEAVLAARFQRGSVSISLGDVLAFLLTVWIAYLLSAFIRFVLQEDVYPKRGVSRGLSFATSRLLHFVILALGFLVGLGILGVDLTRVTVLAGAFGVGIGFGLQDVVNNFVCGMILLFERPIHVGDTIEVGDLLGEVRRIGIRASTVRTGQGADIVVPNSQFITANVTNWTLSDQLRRIDLPVGVNYGAQPKKVIEVLEAVARANPQVLRDPPPRALFVGFGDSSINFEVRAWTDQFINWSKIRSELAVAVYDAVQEAGMSFPFPQREVRVLRDPEAAASASPQPEGRTEEGAAGKEGQAAGARSERRPGRGE